MAYERRILHYANNSTTFVQDLSSRAGEATFTLLRQGGCGPADLQLVDIWSLRNSVDVGDWIAFEYSPGVRWYFGRVDNVESTSRDGQVVQLSGMSVQLSELYPGGFAYPGDEPPRLYARSDYFPNDPDRQLNTWELVSQPEQMIQSMYNLYVAPNTNVTASLIEYASPPVGLDSFTFRGEETMTSILRQAATACKGASWGIDEYGKFFFTQKRSTVLATFQNGVDLRSMRRSKSKELLYNRMLLTGGYIYGTDAISGNFPLANSRVGFYRYRATYHVPTSIIANGERRIRLYVPWIRRNADARAFATEFFRTYASPTERYSVETERYDTLLKPWFGQITLKDFDGTTLTTKGFDEVKCYFNHDPYFEFVVGPEDVQYGDEGVDNRYEIGDPDAAPETPPPPSISQMPTFSGTLSGTFSFSFNPSSSLSSETQPSDGPISETVTVTSTGSVITSVTETASVTFTDTPGASSTGATSTASGVSSEDASSSVSSGVSSLTGSAASSSGSSSGVSSEASSESSSGSSSVSSSGSSSFSSSLLSSSSMASSSEEGTSSVDDSVTGCEECPLGAPSQYRISGLAGITNGDCNECANANGDKIITYQGFLCYWKGELYADCGLDGVMLWELIENGGIWLLTTFDVTYNCAPEDFNCLGESVFTKSDGADNQCAGWPATLTLTPA